ncbi:homocysteine s-methyltransferase 1 [Phtheirospermum japonicum]|uniref:Homocysteine s-methyltransferase 1 n=1 Tax=Phtheirospermum japonicum TaxID=374723 RepID=A0A830BNA0_9LAMI|nr:homocysteine s-methyltransferase 1 [Phtheirospermum japonicum]
MGIEGRKVNWNVLEDLIRNAGGCAVVDGGFATQLEKHGASINDPLWSALCLINQSHLIKLVHLDYLEAGADIIVTSSYQATLPGFQSRGLSQAEAESMLTRSVEIAVDARDKFWSSVNRKNGRNYNRALVAASIGSYGAYLADGSEYSSVDGENAPSGDSFGECLNIINKSDKIRAVGINCAPPQFVLNLIHRFKEYTNKAIVVYPNSGETWDGIAKTWIPSKCLDHEKFEVFAAGWREAGAKIIAHRFDHFRLP